MEQSHDAGSDSYELIAGERRWRAAAKAGWTKVPVVVIDEPTPAHLAELRLIENVQREDLDPVELARAYQALAEQHGLTHERIAERVGQERATISNAIRLLALPPAVLALPPPMNMRSRSFGASRGASQSTM